MYCRKYHKDVPYFGEKSCYTTQEEFRLLFAQEVTKIEQDTNSLTQNANKMAENANIKTKVCKVCGKELPIDQFRPNPKCKDGHLDTCYECLNKKIKETIKKTTKRKEDKVLENVCEGVVEQADRSFPPTQDKYDRLQEYTAQELVDHLRFQGWEVTCTKTIKI